MTSTTGTFRPRRARPTLLRAAALGLLLAATSACSDDGCEPEPADVFNCTDPDDCVAIFLTWNLDNDTGEPDTSGPDMDLYDDAQPPGAAPCMYSGDVHSVDAPMPQEFYICDAPVDGDYVFSWSTFFFFDVDTRIDINENGETSCFYAGKRGTTTIGVP